MSDNQLYDWYGLNESIFTILNSFEGPVIEYIGLLLTYLGHPIAFPVYLFLILIVAWRRPDVVPSANVVVLTLSYVLISILLVPYLKGLFDFPRPLSVLGQESVKLIGRPDAIHSFPSGHAAFAVLMAASLLPGSVRFTRIFLITGAALVCLSRVVVGAHFPADVVAGAALSVVVVLCVRYVLRFIASLIGRISGNG